MPITEFISKEYNKLVNYARKHFSGAGGESAEDIVHDVALNIFSKVDFDSAIENVSAYIYRAIRNRIIDQYRKKGKSAEVHSINESDENIEKKSGEEEFQTDLESEESTALVYEAISRLPEADQQIIYATEYDELTFAELSQKWNVPIGTLLARKHRAMAKIQKLLKDEIN